MRVRPNGLYGRDSEQLALIRALDDPAVRLIVIEGPAGAGKTALADRVLESRRGAQAIIGRGKHAALQTGAAPLLTAMTAAVEMAVEQLYEPAGGLASLIGALGPLAPILGRLDRRLARDGVDVEPAIDSRADAERLGAALETVLGWMAGFGQDVILHIDDWDRASPEIKAVYRRLAGSSVATTFTLIATQRSGDTGVPVGGAHVAVLTLAGLPPLDRLRLLTDAMGGDGDLAARVDGLLDPAATLPLEIIQRLDLLTMAGGLEVRPEGLTLDPARAAAALGEDVAAGLQRRMADLGPDARDAALLMSLIGDRCDAPTLMDATGVPDARRADITRDLTRSALFIADDASVAFTHDTVRAALRKSLTPGSLTDLARRGADRLGTAGGEMPPDRLRAMLLLRLEADRPAIDRVWAERFLIGAEQARSAFELDLAARFADAALAAAGGLDAAPFDIIALVATAAVTDGRLETGDQCARRMRALARMPGETERAFAMSAYVARLGGRTEEAVTFALDGLERLGMRLPRNPGPAATSLAVILAYLRLRLAPPSKPERIDPHLIRMTNAAATTFYEGSIAHTAWLAAASATRPPMAGSLAGWSGATFLAGLLHRRKSASRFGDRAMTVDAEREPQTAPAAYRASFFGQMWSRPIKAFDERHDRIHTAALVEGDLAIAAWSLRNQTMLEWRSGRSLAAVRASAARAIAFLSRIGDEANLLPVRVIDEAARRLMTPQDTDVPLDGQGLPASARTVEAYGLIAIAHANLAGRFDQALALTPTDDAVTRAIATHPGDTEFRFHRALASMRAGRKSRPDDLSALRLAARLNPEDQQARALILRSETLRLAGRTEKALEVLDRAAGFAAGSGRRHDQGLACALGADLARSADRTSAAARFEGMANDAWRAWGAASRITAETPPRPAPQIDSEDLSVADLRTRLELSERDARAKARLLAMVGHELRTPLQAMTGAMDLLEESPGGDDMGMLRSSIARLSATVDDLSDMASLDTGSFSVRVRPFDLMRTLRARATSHRDALAARGMPLVLDVPEAAEIWVQGDEDRLCQILDNLLANAAKYGGGEARLTVRADGETFTFDVSDRGPGLKPEEIVRVFEPFVRGAEVEAARGQGVGLWLARRLAGQLGGDLVVLAGAERGACFRLTLPLPAAPRPGPARPPDTGARRSVLLVEDDILSRDVLSRLMTTDGHEVFAFGNAEAAIAWLEGDPPRLDVALVDHQLPGAGGLAVATVLRKRFSDSGPRIVLASASLAPSLADALRDGEVDRLAQKPISLARLRRLLAEAPKRHGEAAREIDAPTLTVLHRYLDELDQAFERKDGEALRFAAHRMAGAAGQLGLNCLMDRAATVEEAVAQARNESLRAAVEAVKLAMPMRSDQP